MRPFLTSIIRGRALILACAASVAGCGDREGSPPAQPSSELLSSAAQRNNTESGSSTPLPPGAENVLGAELRRFAREMGVDEGRHRRGRGPRRWEHHHHHDRPAMGCDAGSDAEAPVAGSDAGAVEDAGAPAISDAGAEAPPTPPGPVVPAPLPRDVVARAALPIYGVEAGEQLSEEQLWDRVARASAVCLGELHPEPAHHYAQTRAIAELASRSAGYPFALGFEMFQRPYQAPLTAFVEGELGEQELLEQTEYPARWGYDFSLYRPLLESARDLGLPALALNARSELTRKIGRTGLESLTVDEAAELPELDLQNAEHRAFIFGLFGVLPEHAAELGLENIYTAQTVWDETMADTSARWLDAAGAQSHLLIFSGLAHCHRTAIPARITRRTDRAALALRAVFESELTSEGFSPDGYDLLVVLQD